MESRFDRRELLFQPRGIPPLGTSLSLALQHLVAMIDHISLSSSNPENRLRCIKRFKEFIDCAAPYHAQVNIGRVRGELVPGINY